MNPKSTQTNAKDKSGVQSSCFVFTVGSKGYGCHLRPHSSTSGSEAGVARQVSVTFSFQCMYFSILCMYDLDPLSQQRLWDLMSSYFVLASTLQLSRSAFLQVFW